MTPIRTPEIPPEHLPQPDNFDPASAPEADDAAKSQRLDGGTAETEAEPETAAESANDEDNAFKHPSRRRNLIDSPGTEATGI